MNSCGCGARWTGLSVAHCGAAGCHLTFTSVRNFDYHRRNGRCLSADELRAAGYEPNLHGHWRKPAPEGMHERLHGGAAE